LKANCVALTIAGSDSGGGAGIQADLKTFSALGVYGTSVITAITAQNLDGVTGIQPIDPEIVRKQMIAVFTGYPVMGVKTGMLFSTEIIETVTETYSLYKSIPLVIDPVFAATSGSKLIQDSAIQALINNLFPLATVITPNIPEAEFLSGNKINTEDDLKKVAEKLFATYKIPILAKGGHLENSANDILVDSNGLRIYPQETIRGVNNHGSGCTFSAAIAAELAKGASVREAIGISKAYIVNSLKNSHRLKGAVSVMDHFWRWK
jgi:hydroxymethylpyrimidine/phosphomethylpyrimidine kinase